MIDILKLNAELLTHAKYINSTIIQGGYTPIIFAFNVNEDGEGATIFGIVSGAEAVSVSLRESELSDQNRKYAIEIATANIFKVLRPQVHPNMRNPGDKL